MTRFTKISIAAALACAALSYGSAAALARGGRSVTNEKGSIRAVSAEQGWYGIVPDSDEGTVYAPEGLPEELKRDGLRVVFSGEVGEIPPNVRMWGTPLKLTKIEALERASKPRCPGGR